MLCPATDTLQFLSFPEMNRRRQEVNDAAEGTCGWILQDPKFIGWKQEKNGVLWLTGKPGSGKSTLLKHIIKNSDSEILLSFFFYERGSKLQRTCRGLYQTFLHQLLFQYRDLVRQHVSDIVEKFEEAHRSYHGHGNDWVQQNNELQDFLRSCLLRILGTYEVEIVIDALDECTPEDILDLERFFKRLQVEQPSDGHVLRLCITCRNYPLVKWTDGVEIGVDTRNHVDIRTYIDRELKRLDDTADRESIGNDIIERSNGIFLWVVLVLPAVIWQHKAGFDVEQIRAYLQKRSIDLYSVFQDIIGQLSDAKRPESDPPRTLKLFQWLCFAHRPLSLTELRFSMNINVDGLPSHSEPSGDNVVFIKDNKQMEKRVKSLSGGLAEIKKDGDAAFVQLIHQTVKDYLISHGFELLDHRLRSGDATIGHAHMELAAACIQYMSTDELVEKEGPISADDFPFLDYALCSWIPHAEKAEAMNAARDEILICFDWPSPLRVESWVKIWSQWYSGWPVHNTTLLHASARHGLFSAVSAQLWRRNFVSDFLIFLGFKAGPMFERFKPLARSVLQAYYSHGHLDINCEDENGRTALSLASEMGRLDVVKLLLSQDKLDINSRDAFGRTPLLWATTNGHDAVTMELIKRGADLNTQDNTGMTPLHSVAKKGTVSLALLLVENGAKSEIPDTQGRTPLHEATLYGHIGMVRILIDAGADVRAKDKYGDSTLHRACGNRSREVARNLINAETDVLAIADLLLRRGVNINTENDEGVTPLHRAVQNGRKALVALMLERGANIAKADRKGRTPLEVAVDNGDEDIMRLLAPSKSEATHDESAGVRLQKLSSVKDIASSLEEAARNGQEADILQLLEHNHTQIPISARAKALKAAASTGNVAIVKLLLHRNPEMVDHDDVRAALRQAAGDGQVDIVRFLLDFGVPPRATDEYEPSALHLAALSGQEGTARLILGKRPGPGDEEFYGGFALHYAAREGQPALVELLLKNGSYANERTTIWATTPLHAVAETAPAGTTAMLQVFQKKKMELTQEEAAAADRYKAVIQVLLKNGANPRLRNSQGQTALEVAQR